MANRFRHRRDIDNRNDRILQEPGFVPDYSFDADVRLPQVSY